MRKLPVGVLSFGLLAMLSTQWLAAQPLEKGEVEVGGFAGLVAGAGTHANVGAGAAVGVADRVALTGEFSVIPAEANSYEFHAGVHYLIPQRRSDVVPYVAFGMGGIHSSGGGTNFFLNFGGGLRYYLGQGWGLRPEFKIFAGEDTFVRIAVGLFYQFGR